MHLFEPFITEPQQIKLQKRFESKDMNNFEKKTMIYSYQVEMSHIIVNFPLKDFMLMFRICFLLTHHVPCNRFYSPSKISM